MIISKCIQGDLCKYSFYNLKHNKLKSVPKVWVMSQELASDPCLQHELQLIVHEEVTWLEELEVRVRVLT
jgi:hypothetical protein